MGGDEVTDLSKRIRFAPHLQCCVRRKKLIAVVALLVVTAMVLIKRDNTALQDQNRRQDVDIKQLQEIVVQQAAAAAVQQTTLNALLTTSQATQAGKEISTTLVPDGTQSTGVIRLKAEQEEEARGTTATTAPAPDLQQKSLYDLIMCKHNADRHDRPNDLRIE